MLTIPGIVTVHPREVWQDPNLPVTGPSFPSWSNIWLGTVIHYTADDDLIDGDPGEHADQLDDYLRNIQRDYVTKRGYSIGYNFAVDWLGGVWVLRGWDFRNAANIGVKYRRANSLPKDWNANNYTFSILCLVDGADAMTAEASASVRRIIAEANRRRGKTLDILPHSTIEWTGCCGDGIRAQIVAGLLDPTNEPTPPEPPEIDMAQMRVIKLRLRDKTGKLYNDQVYGVSIANVDALRKLGLDDDKMFEATINATRAEIESELGFGLDPA